jgi:hypothetical protein
LIDAAADDLAVREVRRFYSGAAKEFLCGGTHRAVTLSTIKEMYSFHWPRRLFFTGLSVGVYLFTSIYSENG